MKKFNTSPISGAQELLPNLAAQFDQYKAEIAATFRQHGYHCIETPLIERTEILLAKAGGDTEKQIYKVAKTAETMSDADQALRFDHTVPLARYVAEHLNDLPFPFKVTQIGRNFRGERAQKGRFREFYQCDVDVIGWQTLPIAYDADVIATLMDALGRLPLGQLRLRVSNRKILNGLLAELGLGAQAAAIFSIVDHAEKLPPERTAAALDELGLDAAQSQRLRDFMKIAGPRQAVQQQLAALGVQDETFQSGVRELDEVLTLLESMPSTTMIVEADMLIVRGLDYYTGTVFETMSVDYPQIGSLCSGGRYDNLTSHYTDQVLPGVGGSIGLTRLFFILQEYGLLPADAPLPLDYAIIPLAAEQVPLAYQLAAKLRERGFNLDVVLTTKKLGDKLKYAGRLSRYAIIIGEDEAETGQYQVKDLATGEISVTEF